jgi:glycosyltransferase involved in cell wall biosynthesis
MKVSVLINNYNYGEFVDECLLSIQNQTERPDEVIFYDDGSTDNSVELAAKYDFVTIIKNDNFGQKPAFNQANGIYQAFLKSTGDIICLLDSDDFWHPKKIKNVKKAFKENNNAVLVQHAYYEWINGKVAKAVNYGKAGLNYVDLYHEKNWTGFYNPTSNFTFKREYLLKVLPINTDHFWQVWPDVRLSRIAPYYGDIVSLIKPLTYYRRHGNNDSQNMNKNHIKILENQQFHHKYVNLKIMELGEKPIKYKRSLMFAKFFIKAYFLPKLFFRNS